jgi:hypothetical protein
LSSSGAGGNPAVQPPFFALASAIAREMPTSMNAASSPFLFDSCSAVMYAHMQDARTSFQPGNVYFRDGMGLSDGGQLRMSAKSIGGSIRVRDKRSARWCRCDRE